MADNEFQSILFHLFATRLLLISYIFQWAYKDDWMGFKSFRPL